MQNRTPIPRESRPALPDFTPVPRKFRHDGWTPERQKAFIEALADTGCVSRAATMVNMAQRNCYYLRRQPGAEEFRRAWEAALDFGVQRLKDVAFERAIEGELVPVFVAGKLMGYRRKRNDALLMFCLRHYGQDSGGRRTTVNYFSSKAQAGVNGQGGAAAEASTTTVRTVINGNGGAQSKLERDDGLAQDIEGFGGVELDEQAQAEIQAAFLAHAERRRAADAVIEGGGINGTMQLAHDPAVDYIGIDGTGVNYLGAIEPPFVLEELVTFGDDQGHWKDAGADIPQEYADVWESLESKRALPAIAEVKKRKRKPERG